MRCSILREWGVDIEVAHAGLMHSIYGTQGFQVIPSCAVSASLNFLDIPAPFSTDAKRPSIHVMHVPFHIDEAHP